MADKSVVVGLNQAGSTTAADVPGGVEAPSHASHEATVPPRWKRVARRLIPLLILVAILIALNFGFAPLQDVLELYLREVTKTEGATSYLIFIGISLCIVSVMPGGGTLPTIVAGATFPYHIAWAISYGTAQVGGVINLAMVWGGQSWSATLSYRINRLVLLRSHPTPHPNSVICAARLVEAYPYRTVVLFRLPFVAMCILNYTFSLSNIPVKKYLPSNLVGLIPGTLLWTALGGTFRSMFDIFKETEEPVEFLPVFVVVVEMVLLIAAIFTIVYLSRKYSRELREREEARQREQASGAEGSHAGDVAGTTGASTDDGRGGSHRGDDIALQVVQG